MLRPIVRWLTDRHERCCARDTYLYAREHLARSDAILDVGSGTCLVADLLARETGARVVCVDIENLSRCSIEPIVCDARRLPFRDRAFAIVLCCFMLHHLADQEGVLNEALRVSRSKAIIFEDVPDTVFDYPLLFLHRLISMLRYQSASGAFRRSPEWKVLFRKCGFTVEREVRVRRLRNLVYPAARRMYVLTAPTDVRG